LTEGLIVTAGRPRKKAALPARPAGFAGSSLRGTFEGVLYQEVTMNPVRIGVLGISNHWARSMVLPCRDLPEVQFAAVGSRDLVKARQAADRWGIPTAHGSYQAVVDDPDVDAIYIPLPNHLHLEWIQKCADAGKAILCEKPLGLDARQTAEAFEYCAAKGVLLTEAFMYRHHPQWGHCADLVRYGALGDLRAIHGVFAYNNSDANNIRNRLDVGGGALLDIGCYAVSSSRLLVGRDPSRVMALVSRHPVFGTDVLSSAILDYDGVRSVFTVGTLTAAAQRLDAYGASGSLTVKVPFNTPFDVDAEVEVRGPLGPRTVTFAPVNQYALELKNFARAVRGLEAPLVGAAESLGIARTLDALFASAKNDGWVTVLGDEG